MRDLWARRKWMLSVSSVLLSISIGIGFYGCKGSTGGIVQSLLCGTGHDKGALTVGLDFEKLIGLGLVSSNSISNDDLKDKINSVLSQFLGSSQLNIKSVESIGGDDDEYRFMQLSGSFANGFGMATSLLKDALSKSSFGSDIFKSVSESFKVKMAAEDFSREDLFENNFFSHFSLNDNTSFHEDQWAYKQTRFTEAMNLFDKLIEKKGHNKEGNEVVVAVVDTGVDKDHPDLKDILTEGYNALDGSNNADDDNGHGTHCAGIIAGQFKTAGESARGVASNVKIKIMPIKVLAKDGGGGFQAIEKGIRWAVLNNADVISLSLGGGVEFSDLSSEDKKLENAIINDAIDKKVIVVIAAGNESCQLGGNCKDSGGIFGKEYSEYIVLPCSYKNAICVGASDPDEKLASYSNYSSKKDASYRTKVDVNAPGTDIYSTWPLDQGSSYKTISGTSMATPYVAGVAALMKAADPELTQADFLKILGESQIQSDEIVEKSEKGRLDLYGAAVSFANHLQESGEVTDGTFDNSTSKPVDVPESGNSDSSEGGTPFSSLWGTILCQ